MALSDGETLAEKTWLRAHNVADGAPVLTVTSRDYYFYTRDLYKKLGAEESQSEFLLEPHGAQHSASHRPGGAGAEGAVGPGSHHAGHASRSPRPGFRPFRGSGGWMPGNWLPAGNW